MEDKVAKAHAEHATRWDSEVARLVAEKSNMMTAMEAKHSLQLAELASVHTAALVSAGAAMDIVLTTLKTDVARLTADMERTVIEKDVASQESSRLAASHALGTTSFFRVLFHHFGVLNYLFSNLCV